MITSRNDTKARVIFHFGCSIISFRFCEIIINCVFPVVRSFATLPVKLDHPIPATKTKEEMGDEKKNTPLLPKVKNKQISLKEMLQNSQGALASLMECLANEPLIEQLFILGNLRLHR